MKESKPTYYIGTGQKNGFYTLRQQYTVSVNTAIGPQVFEYDQFLRTLSTDATKAVTKAEAMGYKVSTPKFSLDEIKRRAADLVKAEQEERIRIEEERASKAKINHEKLVDAGKWPIGRHTGYDFSVADPKYIMYFGDCADSDYLSSALKSSFPHLFPKTHDKYYGEPKSKYEEAVTCIASFGFDTVYGYTNVIKMATESGHVLTYMGSGSFRAEQGEQMNITFKVKEHSEYNGENQTKVFYVKKKK